MGWVQGYLALNPKSSSPTPTFPIQNIWFNDFGSVTKYISSSSQSSYHLTLKGVLETILSRFKDAYPLTPNGTFPTLNGEWLVTGKDFGVVCMENNRAIPRVRTIWPNQISAEALGDGQDRQMGRRGKSTRRPSISSKTKGAMQVTPKY